MGHPSVSHAIFTSILQGGYDDSLHFPEIIKIVKRQGWRSQGFNTGLNPMPMPSEYCSLVMEVYKLFLPETYLTILLFLKIIV